MIRKIRCDTAMNFKLLNARKEYYMNEYLENQLNKSVVYQQLKDNCERNNQHEVLALVAKVGTFAVERLKTVIKNMPEFTLHDDTHIFNMLTIIGKLIPQENMRKLSTPDLFMLLVSVFLHDIGMAPDEKHILAWKNQLPETEYDEELKEEREKFARFRLTYTHQLADIERLETEQEFSKAQLLEDYIVTEYIRTTHSIRAREVIAKYWAGEIVYQDTDLTEDLATICFSHNESYTYLLQMETFRVCGQDEYLCIPFVATVLRLRVSDNGVGMNQHIIDNYYTNVGCSYYSSREFSELMVSFKSSFTPISRFGIGILSCFMVCDSMEVTTRRIRERFECDEALHISIEGYESLFVISDSNKKEPGTDTILTLRPVHPWDRMNEEEFMQCIKGIVPNPAVQIEIETNKGSELYSSDYFDDLDLKPLLDYSWNNIKNIRKIDIDLICEEYGFKGKGCIGILIKNGLPAEEIEILSKDVEIDGEIYTLSSNIKYKTNCITETSTSISVDEDGEIDTNTSWSERFKSKASLSIHGIEVPYNLFPDYSNRMSKAVLKIPFPFSFRLDIGVNSDLNLNSARDQIIYDEKWLTFEENLYRIICRRLKDTLSSSDWKILNEIIQKNNTDTFSRVANSFE